MPKLRQTGDPFHPGLIRIQFPRMKVKKISWFFFKDGLYPLSEKWERNQSKVTPPSQRKNLVPQD